VALVHLFAFHRPDSMNDNAANGDRGGIFVSKAAV
jgi:hypothetical protein